MRLEWGTIKKRTRQLKSGQSKTEWLAGTKAEPPNPRRWKTCATQQEALAWLASQRLAAGDATPDLTLAAWWAHQLQHRYTLGPFKTWRAYHDHARRLEPFIGRIPLAELTTTQINAALQRIARDQSPSTANGARRHLNAILNQAMKEDIIEKHPGKAAVTFREPQARRPRVRREMVQKILDAGLPLGNAKGDPRARLAVALGIELAMRENEVASLRWQDITPEGILITQQVERLPGGESREAELKDHAERFIPLPPGLRLTQIIRECLADARALASPGDIYIFPHNTRPNSPVYPRTVYGWLQRLLAAATRRELKAAAAEARDPEEIPRLRFHDLRSIAISNFRADGLDPYLIARIAGHEQISTTEKHYIATDSADLAAALTKSDQASGSQNSEIA